MIKFYSKNNKIYSYIFIDFSKKEFWTFWTMQDRWWIELKYNQIYNIMQVLEENWFSEDVTSSYML